MNNIYCVIGETGEYSDHHEWIICWLSDKEEANEYAKLAKTRCDELIQEYGGRYKVPEGANEYDPDMKMDYTGTTYYVCEVPKAIWKKVK
jgi:hypothetical protein